MALNVLFVNPNFGFFSVPNLGLAMVMTLVAREHRIRLLDFTFHAHESGAYLNRRLQGFVPDIIAVSVNNFTLPDAQRISQFLKKRYPHAGIVWGGVYPTLFPEESIQLPFVDAICQGEGEAPLQVFLRLREKGKSGPVPRIRQKEQKEILVGPVEPFEQALDRFPFPDWDHWEIERYLHSSQFFFGSLIHAASRGCPMDCTFCTVPVLKKTAPGNFYRLRSPDHVIEEISKNSLKYHRLGMRMVSFVDSLFGLNAVWLERFCRGYIQKGLARKVKWHCQTRADILTRDMLSLMKEAGCILIDMGIESGNEFIRNQVYRKNIAQREIQQAVALLREAQLAFRINIILGCPVESAAAVRDSLRLMRDIKPTVSRYTFYQPLPKTALYEQLALPPERNRRGLLNPWDYLQCKSPHCSTFFLSILMWRLRFIKSMRACWYGIKSWRTLGKTVYSYLTTCPLPRWHPYFYLNLIEYLEQEYIYQRGFSFSKESNRV